MKGLLKSALSNLMPGVGTVCRLVEASQSFLPPPDVHDQGHYYYLSNSYNHNWCIYETLYNHQYSYCRHHRVQQWRRKQRRWQRLRFPASRRWIFDAEGGQAPSTIVFDGLAVPASGPVGFSRAPPSSSQLSNYLVRLTTTLGGRSPPTGLDETRSWNHNDRRYCRFQRLRRSTRATDYRSYPATGRVWGMAKPMRLAGLPAIRSRAGKCRRSG